MQDVEITITGTQGMVVVGTLTVTGAKDVTVSSTSGPAITSNATITCTGDVSITSADSTAVSGSLTVTDAGKVTVTGPNSSAIGGQLTYTPAAGYTYIIRAGTSLDDLSLVKSGNLNESYGPESQTEKAILIEATLYIPTTGGSYTPTYPPIVEDTDNGSVSLSPQAPAQGGTVTVTPKAEDGYEVGSVTVTDRNGNPVAVKDNGDGTYSFTQPAGKVTVTVTFQEVYVPCDGGADCPAYHFADVNATLWYHEAVDYVTENGMMNGVGGNQFAPNSSLSRSMLMTMLARLDGVDTDDGATWYEKGMDWAMANGISDGTNPDSSITREQIAAMLYRYGGSRGQ